MYAEWNPQRIIRFSVVAAVMVAIAVVIGLLVHPQPRLVNRQLGDLVLVVNADAAAPSAGMSEETAHSQAATKLHEIYPDAQDAVISASSRTSGLTEVRMKSGTSRFQDQTGLDAWVIEYTVTAKQGYAHGMAAMVLDAQTGQVKNASLLYYN